MESRWATNWPEELERRLELHGLKTATELAERHPRESLVQLAQRLGGKTLGVQLRWRLVDEALNAGELNRLARREFFRAIHVFLADGWALPGAGGIPFRVARAFAYWTTFMGEHNEANCNRVLNRLRGEKAPPLGWLPETPDDDVLLDAFEAVQFADAPHSLR